jgi:16S rRNA (guanine527-N7)-methyltransferase
VSQALTQLQEGIETLGLEASPTTLARFGKYLRELLFWKQALNLTAASSEAEVVGLHFLDSLLPLTILDFRAHVRVIDVGSGAGFPGVPLKLIRPDLALTLVEASRRRVAFLEHLRTSLGLDDVEIVWANAELLAHRTGMRESFGVAIERATAPAGRAVELCLPFVEIGGAAVLLKGPGVEAEIPTLSAVAAKLGGQLESSTLRNLPTICRQRATIVIRKISPTPEGFPRRRVRRGQPPGGAR